jgi:cell division protein FtsN
MAGPAVATTVAAAGAPVVATMAPAAGAGSPATGPANAKSAKAASPAKAPSIDTLLAEAPPPATVKRVQTASTTPPRRVEKASVATAKPPETASTAVAKHASPTGGYVVQIGAFSSPALADKEWSSAAGLASETMAGKGKRVAQITKDGATLYRTAITGFDTREQAQAVCAKLVAAGKACFVR